MSDSLVGPARLVPERHVHVTDGSGSPLREVKITRVASNGTYLDGISDAEGSWHYQEPFTGTVTFLVSGEGLAGAYEVVEPTEWEGPLEMSVPRLLGGGSITIARGTGYVAGLDGQLNPIRDSGNRFYIYGDNISFSEQPNQPFSFSPGLPFTASDAHGNVFELTVLVVLGRTSLVRYQLQKSTPIQA